MPLVAFDTLPADARVWVFATGAPLDDLAARTVLAAVDDYLARWHAHGTPLTVGRDWRDQQFLTIGVDLSHASASGCSIDGLFRLLRGLEPTAGTSLVGSGLVYYRDSAGAITSVDRPAFTKRAERGDIMRMTPVFDLSVTTLADWRDRFETTAGQSWHATLLPAQI